MATWPTQQQLRREKLRLRQRRLFESRQLLPDFALTEELARLRGIEAEAFHLLTQALNLESLPDGLRVAFARLEHAVLVEVAPLPTLRAAP